MLSSRLKKRFAYIVFSCLMIIILLIYLFPAIWTIQTSFRILREINSIPPVWIPSEINWEHYIHAFFGYGGQTKAPFPTYLRNSLLTASAATFIALVIGVMAGYSFANFEFKARRTLFFSILLTRAIPGISLSLPLLILFRRIHLVDNIIGTVIIYVVLFAPFVAWLMEGFFTEIPKELRDAALLDGCSHWQSFIKIALPLARPGLAASGILTFMLSWNEFQVAVILTSSLRSKTAPVGLFDFVGEFFTDWGGMSAASTVMIIPIVVFVILVQKHLVRGLTFGAMK